MKRAPYVITALQLVERFGHTPERRKILRGFFNYRAKLRELKITEGFQWVDGSFVEEIEVLESRPPGDIDVVTFYRLPEGETQKTIFAKAPEYFPANEAEKQVLKDLFHVDTMMSSLDVTTPKAIKQGVFFYSIWAHRRDFTWKGFVQIDLDDQSDAAALSYLNTSDQPSEEPLLELGNEI